ncbi:CLUMA_CG020727, isoform A [Clunio marinus]|uniref:CLUMA_CG020727, isoform A n=1 Tax=Clunio marinus TaxID=568069 RepID=A0A1J1J5V3_9DIPT|nr:CLUMA_CG020727, isoform A [Clunio marinus]
MVIKFQKENNALLKSRQEVLKRSFSLERSPWISGVLRSNKREERNENRNVLNGYSTWLLNRRIIIPLDVKSRFWRSSISDQSQQKFLDRSLVTQFKTKMFSPFVNGLKLRDEQEKHFVKHFKS